MSECPEIVVYWLTQESACPVAASEYIGRYYQADKFLPMVFSGDTPSIVIAAAQLFWSEETRKIESRRTRLIKAREARHGRSR